MRLPVFEEIILKNFNETNLRKKLNLLEIGETPYFINLTGMPLESALQRLEALKNILHELEINTFFPYPLFIIHPEIKELPDFPVVSEERLLPTHFMKKTRRLRGREISLLNKTNLLAKKSTNLEISKNWEKFLKINPFTKLLSQVTEEVYFYESLLEKLKAEPRKEEENG